MDFLKQLIKQSYKITILFLSPILTTGHRKTQPTQLTHKFEREARSCCWGSSSSEGVQNLHRKLKWLKSTSMSSPSRATKLAFPNPGTHAPSQSRLWVGK